MIYLFQLIHINQAHYDDIVEERSIVKLCGYPLCGITLNDIPKQQYTISKAQNKVYDITERKKFCSNKCYKSSDYLKEQIPNTPLWVRKEDDVIPEFKLLSIEDKGQEHRKVDEKQVDEIEDRHKQTDKSTNNTSGTNDV